MQQKNDRIMSASAASTEETETETSHGSNQTTRFTNGQMIIIFIFFGLGFGAILKEIDKKIGIPFAPFLLLICVGLGCIYSKLGFIGDTVETMIKIDPHIILATFIVPIVFESAFDADGYVMKRNAWAIFMVSFPGAIAMCFLLACCFRYALWYEEELGFAECLVMGSMLAMTDPVAIGDLLKTVRVKAKFGLLLEAESHFTDGSAFVIFMIALHAVVHGTFAWDKAIVYFIQLTFGGIGMGIVFSIPFIYWLKKLSSDNVEGVMLTICGAFITFFMSEFVLNVSGILALEMFGLMLGAFCKPAMTEALEHSIGTVWGVLTSCIEM